MPDLSQIQSGSFSDKVFEKQVLPDVFENFGQIYIETREKEGRIYTDGQVVKLPEIENSHQYHGEWKIRENSARHLKKYIETNDLAENILEIGCGNGWLSNYLTKINGSNVLGIDVNKTELVQALRVFKNTPNLNFALIDIFNAPFPSSSFSVIILASVIQYFPDIEKLINTLLPYLKSKGEIHILDSPFYSFEELQIANKRSRKYYVNLGMNEMAENYFHHSLQPLQQKFNTKIIYSPVSIKTRIYNVFSNHKSSPFPWLRIIK